MNFLLIMLTFFKAANNFSPSQKALLETISFVSLVVGLMSAFTYLLFVLPTQFYPFLSLVVVGALVVYCAYIIYTINLDKYERQERIKNEFK